MRLHQIKGICTAKETQKKMKREPTEWENILTNDVSEKGLISKIDKEHSSTLKQTIQLKIGQRIWVDTSPKRTYKWPTDIWRNTQCYYSSERCKLKPQWDFTSHLLEWPSLINQQTILLTAVRGVEVWGSRWNRWRD